MYVIWPRRQRHGESLLPGTPQELFSLAKEDGIELTDKQIEMISGGEEWVKEDLEMLVTKKCNVYGTDVTVSTKTGNVQCPSCGTWVYVHLPF